MSIPAIAATREALQCACPVHVSGIAYRRAQMARERFQFSVFTPGDMTRAATLSHLQEKERQAEAIWRMHANNELEKENL